MRNYKIVKKTESFRVGYFKTSIIALLSVFCVANAYSQEVSLEDFDSLRNDKNWELEFEDSCNDNWKDSWFLDGLRADVKNTEQGMVFSAGPIEKDDSCHAVLWTKQSFSGDIKIEYNYTRLDSQTKQVNILYIQATGEKPYEKDIEIWKDERIIPSMRMYFNHMNALHISYAAFGDDQEYVRARRYPRKTDQDFQLTEIPPSFYNTGLFKTGETYKITVIKKNDRLFFQVQNAEVNRLFQWQLKPEQLLDDGRVGLRHMYTRSSLYRNFKIYTSK